MLEARGPWWATTLILISETRYTRVRATELCGRQLIQLLWSNEVALISPSSALPQSLELRANGIALLHLENKPEPGPNSERSQRSHEAKYLSLLTRNLLSAFGKGHTTLRSDVVNKTTIQNWNVRCFCVFISSFNIMCAVWGPIYALTVNPHTFILKHSLFLGRGVFLGTWLHG